jgi:tetratricopeptide (TPR) repeat protein
MGRSEEAIAFFKKSAEISPRFSDAYYNLALEYFFKKQYAPAILYCDKAASLGYEVPRRLRDP